MTTLPPNDPSAATRIVEPAVEYIYVASGGGAGSGGLAALGSGSDAVVTDPTTGVRYAYQQFKFAFGPNKGNNGAVWTAAAVGAGANSPTTHLYGSWSKVQIYASASAATNITIQVSPDGTNWYTLTQDNAGTAWMLALTASQLAAARDLPAMVYDAFRLVSSAAVTITAGFMCIGV